MKWVCFDSSLMYITYYLEVAITYLLPLDPVKQRQLVGLAAATIDFLILSTRLPLPSASTDEEIEVMKALLQKLMQVSLFI